MCHHCWGALTGCFSVMTPVGPLPMILLPPLITSNVASSAASAIQSAASRPSTVYIFVFLMLAPVAWTASASLAYFTCCQGFFMGSNATLTFAARVLKLLLCLAAAHSIASRIVKACFHGDACSADADHLGDGLHCQDNEARELVRERAIVLCMSQQPTQPHAQSTIPDMDAELLRHIIELANDAEHPRLEDLNCAWRDSLLDLWAFGSGQLSSCVSMSLALCFLLVSMLSVIAFIPAACCWALAYVIDDIRLRSGNSSYCGRWCAHFLVASFAWQAMGSAYSKSILSWLSATSAFCMPPVLMCLGLPFLLEIQIRMLVCCGASIAGVSILRHLYDCGRIHLASSLSFMIGT